MGFDIKKISLYVLAFALFYAMFERHVLRFLWCTIGVWENFIVKMLKEKVCLSHIPINAIIRKRLNKVVENQCETLGRLDKIQEFDFKEMKTDANLCPKLDAIGTSQPWVVRNFFDASDIDMLKILQENRHLPIGVFNKTDWTNFVHDRVMENEYGKGCSWVRSERRFGSNVGDWLDLTESMPADHQYYVAFDWHMANMVYDKVKVKGVCGHDLQRTHVDAFLTRKKSDLPPMVLSETLAKKLGEVAMADTSPHCAAESNHFFMISGKKKWVMVDPTYSPEMSLMHDNLMQNAVVMSPFIVKCLPRMEFYLHPGDILYVPPWWFHEVYNIPEGGEKGSIVFGMATRFLEFGGAAWYHPIPSIYKWLDDKFNGRTSTTDAQNTLLAEGANTQK